DLVEFDRVCGDGALVDRHTGDVWFILLITKPRFKAVSVRAGINQVVVLGSTRGVCADEQGIASFWRDDDASIVGLVFGGRRIYLLPLGIDEEAARVGMIVTIENQVDVKVVDRWSEPIA